MAYQNVGIDLPGIFLAAQQARTQQQQNEIARAKLAQMQEQQKIADLLPEARQYAASGRPEMLRMIAPKEYQAIQDAQREQKQYETELQFKQAKEAREQQAAEMAGFSKPFVEGYNQVYGQLTPERAQAITPEQILRVRKVMAASQKAKAPKTNISIGPNGEQIQALTGGQQSAQQGKVIDATQRIRQIDDIVSSIDKIGGFEKLTDYSQRAKQTLQNVAEKTEFGRKYLISDEDRKAMDTYSAATAQVAGFANKIINEISGAAVSEQEWERLVKSLPNPETDGPTMLRSKLGAWRKNLEYVQQYGIDALFNGMRSGAIKIESGAPVDSEGTARRRSPRNGPKKQTQTTANIDNVSRAVEAAVSGGVAPQDAVSRLLNAGKIDQQTASSLLNQYAQTGNPGAR